MLFLSSLRSSVAPFVYCVLIASVVCLVQVTGPNDLAVASSALAGTRMKSESPQDEPRTFRQARKALVAPVVENPCPEIKYVTREVRITSNEIQLRGKVDIGNGWNQQWEEGSFSIRFDDIKKIHTYGGKYRNIGYYGWIETKSHQPAKFLGFCFRSYQALDQFTANLNWLVAHAPEFPALEAARRQEFNRKAAEWRAAPIKTPLPEDARRHKVLAENAIQEKDSEKAIDEYEAGLDVFPTWPEGQFNVALLCGEGGDYEEAIEHMEDYLKLVPDAADAQAARDKIVVWQDKLGH
jgi:hypothetical protein